MEDKQIKNLIDARKLQKILKNKSQFTDWIKRNISANEFKINEDYYMVNAKLCDSNLTNTYKWYYYLTDEATIKILTNYLEKAMIEKINIERKRSRSLREIINDMDEKVKIIRLDDAEYPERLKKIKNPPRQLYVKGNIENLKEYGLAVIGTRNCSMYGRKITKIFTNNLVGYNLNIISGLAKGIDTCAHKACIKANGKTIAVLPSGLDNIFPKENEELVDQILTKGGTIVTEYPPEFKKTPESCRQRNRIISGLAIGTLVIEAGDKSGTTSTIRHTNEEKKKAFCIPGNLTNSKSIGTNQMIKQNIAKPVTEVEDIIKEFLELKLKRKEGFQFAEINRNKKSKESKLQIVIPDIEEENLEIYNCLKEEAKDIDEIAQLLNKTTNEVAYKLTLLELEGIIEELPGKKFKIK